MLRNITYEIKTFIECLINAPQYMDYKSLSYITVVPHNNAVHFSRSRCFADFWGANLHTFFTVYERASYSASRLVRDSGPLAISLLHDASPMQYRTRSACKTYINVRSSSVILKCRMFTNFSPTNIYRVYKTFCTDKGTFGRIKCPNVQMSEENASHRTKY